MVTSLSTGYKIQTGDGVTLTLLAIDGHPIWVGFEAFEPDGLGPTRSTSFAGRWLTATWAASA